MHLDYPHEFIKATLDSIEPNPWQPRRDFDPKELEGLAGSISREGILQPIVLSLHPFIQGKYYVIAGERRFRAAGQVGLKEVPAILIKLDPEKDDQLRIALIENIQRSNLNIIEEGRAYRALIDRFGYTQEECAKKLGKERVTITHALRVLSLPEEIHADIIAGRITPGHAKILVGLSDRLKLFYARDLIVNRGLSVKETEKLCRKIKNSKGEGEAGEGVDQEQERQRATPNNIDPDLQYIQENLQAHLGVRVQIRGNVSNGRIELSYMSVEDFEKLWRILQPNKSAH